MMTTDNNNNNNPIPASSAWNPSSSPNLLVQRFASDLSGPRPCSPTHQTSSSHLSYDSLFITERYSHRNADANESLTQQQPAFLSHLLPQSPSDHSLRYTRPFLQPWQKSTIVEAVQSDILATNLRKSCLELCQNGLDIGSESSNTTRSKDNQQSKPSDARSSKIMTTPTTPFIQNNDGFTFSKAGQHMNVSCKALSNTMRQEERPKKVLKSQQPSSQNMSTLRLPSTKESLHHIQEHNGSATSNENLQYRGSIWTALDEARMQAQNEAESYAITGGNSRDVPEVAPFATNLESFKNGKAETKCQKKIILDTDDDLERRKLTKIVSEEAIRTHEKGRDRSQEKYSNCDMKELEAKRSQQYQRRLDMNRKSAAVSRVRRRAYVKELEERLAAVEAEKFQMEGKLEIMMSQNESYKRRLDQLLLMMIRSPQKPINAGKVQQTGLNQDSSHNIAGVSIADSGEAEEQTDYTGCSLGYPLEQEQNTV